MAKYDPTPNKLGLREHRGTESKTSNPLLPQMAFPC